MAFMKLFNQFGRWYLVEGRQGTDIIPAAVCGDIGIEPGETVDRDDADADRWAEIVSSLRDCIENREKDIESVECVEKWGSRYSAPGYLDCTDWVLGDTEAEAEKDCREMYGSDDDEEEEDYNESPDIEDGDYTTTDYRHFYQYGKCVVSISADDYDANPDGWEQRVRDHMRAENFYPSVWWISDHGNPNQLTMTEGNSNG